MTGPRTVILRLCLGLGLPLLLTGCLQGPPVGHQREDAAVGLTVFGPSGQPTLPTLAGSTLSGRRLTASSYAAGSPLVVNVWASWCSPCRRELPLLVRTARRGVRVLGIDERDTESRARAFARSHGAVFPSLSDPDGKILASLRVLPQAGIPSTLVVDPSGRIVARVVGPLTPRALARALTKAAT
ncbi:MAG TPA: TlpA disulfide reductase family protein [Nocardioides sp.]|uniref:TlpA family protein disulfide reductase n=1 Tax=Nocardioides sp. TaxID=35761 RepID=UPI002E3672D6|nr:TlpA disulfide reductase family protein [Nocardioides sp.]HEX3931067.1 TlpA disulfide reductase family protein [Nocardioides sp.]